MNSRDSKLTAHSDTRCEIIYAVYCLVDKEMQNINQSGKTSSYCCTDCQMTVPSGNVRMKNVIIKSEKKSHIKYGICRSPLMKLLFKQFKNTMQFIRAYIITYTVSCFIDFYE